MHSRAQPLPRRSKNTYPDAGHYVPAVASRVFHASKSGELDPPVNLQVGGKGGVESGSEEGGVLQAAGRRAGRAPAAPWLQAALRSPLRRPTTHPPNRQGLAIGNGLTDPAIQYGAYRWAVGRQGKQAAAGSAAAAGLPGGPRLACLPTSTACLPLTCPLPHPSLAAQRLRAAEQADRAGLPLQPQAALPRLQAGPGDLRRPGLVRGGAGGAGE